MEDIFASISLVEPLLLISMERICNIGFAKKLSSLRETMAYFAGIDIGTVSIKAALVCTDGEGFLQADDSRAGFRLIDGDPEIVPDYSYPTLISDYRRLRGRPVSAARQLLDDILAFVPGGELGGIRIIGAGGKLLGNVLGAGVENEFKAIARCVEALYPEVRSLFEMGGQNSKYIRFERDNASGRMGIADYETNGDCAAGTGSFMDQQASRLKYDIEEVGDVVRGASKAAKIAGRCSVFAKSDMIHAQQKGYQPPEVLKGLCEAVARNFKSAITKGKKISPVIAFIGGVAANAGVVGAMEEVFGLEEGELFIPRYHSWLGALGAALMVADASMGGATPLLRGFRDSEQGERFPVSEPLLMDKVLLLRDRVKPYTLPENGDCIDVYLGIDIGSVSTNLVMIDEKGEVVYEIYTRTEARPIQAVGRGLIEMRDELGSRVEIKGVGTTGSGRELIGQLVGADSINDEITAHKTGASFIGNKLIGAEADTIFEIGGQDSKFISLENGVVVDFAMNEACAAGTGSFLEERAEELGVSIKDEFSCLALGSPAPIRLGERCTVFMEQDVNSYLQRGARKEDLLAGLAYSIAYNYINRVVRGRRIGDTIFFQGGTAYNDSVAAAFSKVLDKQIIVPPHNGVMGAIGAALLARDKVNSTGAATGFRGYEIEEVDYTLKEFTCQGCTNFCDIQLFDVEGEKTYWGDKCSDRYRKQAKTDKKPVIQDLFELRDELMFEGYQPSPGSGPTVGIPLAMYAYDRLPFWLTFFKEIGFNVLLSARTNRKTAHEGVENTVAEPCFPIQVAHGHVAYLLHEGADYIFIPNQVNAEASDPRVESHACPWGQTLPYVVRRSPAFASRRDIFIMPSIRFREGRRWVTEALMKLARKHKILRDQAELAVEKAYGAQERFTNRLREAGREALQRLEESGEPGIVMVGRPYNIYDKGINLDVPAKLRDYYGVNVIPIDFLPLEDVDISDVNDNMYWNYGHKILAAAKIVSQFPNLHIIYITNFKCGPDSFVKHFISSTSGKPFLSLQFDGHSNDAGIMTRCEAYLDSKGMLRWWYKAPQAARL
jgi:predicted CoA-substrate-specific enzyme activase